jgi:hypothetical protein
MNFTVPNKDIFETNKYKLLITSNGNEMVWPGKSSFT